MLGFFVARADGRELRLSPAHWRGAVGRVAATFATPIPTVMAMDWTDIVAWHAAADEIHDETWGLLPTLMFGMK